MVGQKYNPQFINTDLHPSYCGPNLARFIKNLAYSVEDTSGASNSKDARSGSYKTLQSVKPYVENFTLPDGYNHFIGGLKVDELRQVFAFIYNENGNHTIYRLNGVDGTYDIVRQTPDFNFQLDPRYFIHQGGSYLQIVTVTDPDTGLQKNRTFLMFTDGFNSQRFLCVEDSIDTNGFDSSIFPYFKGNYDRGVFINMGVATPKDCITVNEVARTDADAALNNNLLFNTWQFRVKYIDVWGRPSEHGIISNMYVPGINDCIGASSGLPRCLNLVFPAPDPTIDKVQVEYRNCIDDTWYISDTLFLYNGSPLGQWWKRARNTTATANFTYDGASGNLTYTFCRDHECQPVPTNETARVSNPLPRTSQAIAKVGDFINLGNNKDGFDPFSQDLLDKISVTVEPPENVAIGTSTITIYIPIWNEGLGTLRAVFKNGTTNYEWGDNDPSHGGAARYLQYFINPQQSGFGGYLVGTGNYVISTQWYLDANGDLVEDVNKQGLALSPRGIIFQKFVFTNIPKGNYVFRLFSHQTDPAINPSYTATSTTVWGLCSFNSSSWTIGIENRMPSQELLISTCNGDYDTLKDNKILVIADLAYGATEVGAGFGRYETNKVSIGYWFETNKNGFSQFPMELLKVTGSQGYNSGITDHNGFFWFATRGNGRSYAFTFTYKCNQVRYNLGQGGDGIRVLPDLIIDQLESNGWFPWADYASTDGITGKSCNRVLIKGKVVLTGSNIPVPNVTIVLTRGQFAATDANGNFTVVAHDDNTNTSGTRNDNLVLASGTCAYTAPDGGCIPIQAVTIVKCNSCAYRELDVKTIVIQYLTGRGLLSGGTYGVATEGWDFLGRPTFAEPIKYITIPTINESQVIGPTKIRVDIAPDAVFPPETTYITFSMTEETTIETYIDWIVDKVDFVDNTGAVNLVAPTQIKIYYASLNEYNKQNNFNTTTNWSSLETLPGTTTQTPYTHDVVYFYLNGDGKYYTTAISALIKYDQTGVYFLIDYIESLAGLLPNALIRLVRPKVCTGIEGYFESCTVVNISNRSATQNKFYLNVFDTYYNFRQIPVPVFVNPTNTNTTSSTVKQVVNADGSTTTVTQSTNDTITQINEPRTFGFPFESNSPSNFWGSGCYNQGRSFAKNPFEAVVYNIDRISISGALSTNGVLNYLNYFDDARMVDFNATKINGIVAILPETALVLIVGQDDFFIVGFSDSLARGLEDGTISTGGTENAYGQPQGKIGSNYGCKLMDKNTIYKYKGLVQYLDTNECAIIQNNYQDGKPFTETGADSIIKTKIKWVQDYNNKNPNQRYFTGVVNPASNEYIITDKVIKSKSFVNTLRDYDFTQQETFAFGLFSRLFRATYGFTPDGYASLEGDISDRQLFSFINGIPHKHYNTNSDDYGVIYGQVVNRSLRIVVSVESPAKKKPLSLNIYCKQGTYFSDYIYTETGQLSRILLSQFLQAQFGFYAPFLCDINTPPNPDGQPINSIMDGDILVGTWMEVNLVGDPKFDNQYTELESIVVNVIKSEYSGVQ